MNQMIEISKEYCKEKHKNVERNDKKPHYEHSFRVGDMVSNLIKDEDIIIASYLHDIFDSGSGTEKEVLNLFNEKVVDIIKELTNDKEMIKIKGKFKYMVDKINSISDESLLIKLCDRYDNLTDSGHKPSYVIETTKLIKLINRPLTDTHKKIINLINSVTNN